MSGSRTARPPGAQTGAPETARPAKRRLIGIDIARGATVLGMFAAHFNPYQLDPDDWLRQLVSGRSAVLFALLAGVSVALISGGDAPRHGNALRTSRIHIAVRAVLLFVLGLGLTSLGTSVKEILTVYAVLFLLAIPLLRVRPVVLAALTGVLALVGPIVSFVLRSTVITRYQPGATPTFGDFGSGRGVIELVEGVLVTGPYPVLTWLPFLLAGMAIGRLDLRSTTVRVRLLVTGFGAAALAYGTSWLLMNALGGYARIAETVGGGTALSEARAMAETTIGAVPTGAPEFLLITTAHSGAPLEIVAATGCAMVVIGASLFLAERFPRTLTPLASIGALALTSYVGHVVVIFVLGFDTMVHLLVTTGYLPLLALVGVTALVTTAWRRVLGRGPLEWVLHRATTAAGTLTRSP